VGKKQKKRDAAASLGTKLPTVTPSTRCKLRLLKLERIKDYLLMEHEFVQNQERLKPQDERNEEDRSKASAARLEQGVAQAHGAAVQLCMPAASAV
jgi:26S proteasome regulatory subunit T2